MKIDQRLTDIASSQPYRLLFMTISGAHLYSFPSPDSDFDLRGVHILPASMVVGLADKQETIESHHRTSDLDVDYVTHDIKKFCLMLLKRNGYVLEQLYSPLIVMTSSEHEELKAIARGCITKGHCHHYLGFSARQWQTFETSSPYRVKPLLYVYRTLLTGIHLMRTGEVDANLLQLNADMKLPYIDDLVGRKLSGTEDATLDNIDLDFHRAEYQRLRDVLVQAHQSSALPESPQSWAALNDFLIRLRLNSPAPS